MAAYYTIKVYKKAIRFIGFRGFGVPFYIKLGTFFVGLRPLNLIELRLFKVPKTSKYVINGPCS